MGPTGAGKVVHVVGFLHYVAWFVYDFFYFTFPESLFKSERAQSLGRIKFLTYWDMLLQTAFFALCVLTDVVATRDSSLRRFKDLVHGALAVPLALFVSVTFWALYAVDRELVFPRSLDAVFPPLLNHTLHSSIVVWVLLETLTSPGTFPSKGQGLRALLAFMLVYLVWTHFILFYTGEWTYPVLAVLNWGQRILFYVTLLALAVFLYFVGETVSKLAWGKQTSVPQKAPKSKKRSS